MEEKKATLGCYMIVKDEEGTIGTCIDSIKDICDEIIVVDTGCSDKTMEIVRSYGEKVRTYEFEWIDDFSAARNFAMNQVSTDYSFTIDADEVLSPLLQEAIKGLKDENFNGKDSYDIWLLNKNNDKPSTYYIGGRQIVKQSPENTWKYRVHEKLYYKRDDFGTIPLESGYILHSHGENAPASNYNKYAEYYFHDLLCDNILKADNGAHYFYYFFMTLKGLDISTAKFYLSEAYRAKRIHSYTEDQRPNLYMGNYMSAEELFAMNLSVNSKDYTFMEEMGCAMDENVAKYILLKTVYDNDPSKLTQEGWLNLCFCSYIFGKVNDFVEMTEKSAHYLKKEEVSRQNVEYSLHITKFQDEHPVIIDCRKGHDALSSNLFYFLNMFKKVYVLGDENTFKKVHGLHRYRVNLLKTIEECPKNAFMVDGNRQTNIETALSEFEQALKNGQTKGLIKNGDF